MKLRSHSQSFIPLWLILLFTVTCLSTAIDTISAGQSLTSKQTLISRGGKFALGFFSPGNSDKYYVGIWYNHISVQHKTYVWVVNRNSPVSYRSELKLLENGNLVLVESYTTKSIWSTNTTANSMSSSQAVLKNDGNFLLRNSESDVYWQSFDHPTDTFLPGGWLGYNNRTKESQRLTSWKNVNDPAEGIYSLELDPAGDQYHIRWNKTEQYWSSGQWNGKIFSKVPEMEMNYIYNFSYFTYDVYKSSNITTRFVMDITGQGKQLTWDATSEQWFLIWSRPRQQCEVYAYCGAYGVCNQNAFTSCKCMEGFEPRSYTDWNMAGFSYGGCVRKKPLKCRKDEFSLMSEGKQSIRREKF
ncbi:non-specific serine/threonine protein kinase [Ranunculus cassubicifolius]